MRILGQPSLDFAYSTVVNHKAGWGDVKQLNGERRFFLLILKLNDIAELWKCSFKMIREEWGSGKQGQFLCNS